MGKRAVVLAGATILLIIADLTSREAFQTYGLSPDDQAAIARRDEVVDVVHGIYPEDGACGVPTRTKSEGAIHWV